MNELVLMHHNEPMTTSLAIAEGVELPHKTVLQLIRKHVGNLQDFGEIAFEMRKSVGRPTEFAWLNEGQSIFLLTLMRNSEIVVAFKKALVMAFIRLRDNALAQITPNRDDPLTLSHRADNQVSAGRVFGAMMRVGRTAGLSTAQQLRRAFAITLEKTGIDLLEELQMSLPEDKPATRWESLAAFMADWQGGVLPVPFCVCRKSDLHRAYQCWARSGGHEPMRLPDFSRRLGDVTEQVREKIVMLDDPLQREDRRGVNARVWVPVGTGTVIPEVTWQALYTREVNRFKSSLSEWEAEMESEDQCNG